MRAAGEDRLLSWLRRRLGSGGLLGDDAAVLPPGWEDDRGTVVTVDSQIEGVHFPAGLDPAVLARRVLAVNLSDLAAMGARPAYALLALSTPRSFDHRRFFTALVAACRRHSVTLAGGDLARCPTGVVASLTLLGAPFPGGRLLARGGARPGHGLWVGGTLGESAAGARLVGRGARLEGRRVILPEGLGGGRPVPRSVQRAARQAVRRHLSPKPQIELGRRLGELLEGAAMDLSDGLALDLRRLCRESGVGAEVEGDALPTAPGFDALCRLLGEDPTELALGGGEDYVLLFTLPPETAPPAGHPCRRIGTVTRSRALSWRRKSRSDGRSEPLPELGWDHLDM